MIFSCDDCHKSFKTEDEILEIIPISRTVTQIAIPNLSDLDDMPLSESEKTELAAKWIKDVADDQKQCLEDSTPRSFGEFVSVVDVPEGRVIMVYQELEPVSKTQKDDTVIFFCTFCKKILCLVLD